MKLLTTNSVTGSIVTPLTAITYTQSSPMNLLAMLRVAMGSTGNPIAGSGTYTISVYVNSILMVPVSAFNVPAGATKAFSISREIVLAEDDVLTVTVQGQGSDSSVALTVDVYDVTPVTVGESTGTGQTLVDHNYPTANNMTLLDGAGEPIVGACIYIYLDADFTDGNLAPEFIVAKSTTIEGGIWKQPVALNDGAYVAYFFKQGVMSPTSLSFTVGS